MAIDLALLRIIKYKESFDKVSRYIPRSAIDKRTRAVADDIGRYYAMNPDETVLDFPSFRSLFFTSFHRGLKDEDCQFYNSLIDRMEQDVPEQIKKNIINQLLELEFATDVANLLNEYEAGEEIDIVAAIANTLKGTQETLERTTSFEFADLMDSTVTEDVDEDSGYLWPITALNESYRTILGGDQTIIAARPGQGKTTFLTHLNWCMAQSMSENKVIVWFNNESRRQRIMSRQIQSALNKTNAELQEMHKAGTLNDAYVAAMGRPDKVRVYDIHGKNNSHLEDILESVGLDNVGAIVIDMLDNVKFPVRGDMREDQRLEHMYQWSRELGVRYNCPVFPTSQVSNEGAGLLFPTENMLKDSKTGKQGACDNIIMIGSPDDPFQPHLRGISMPKTKSQRSGKSPVRAEVLLDGDRGRYINP